MRILTRGSVRGSPRSSARGSTRGRIRGVERRAESGVISLFVVVLFVAFLLTAGLVIDSAELRGQRRALSDLARQAARAAVQEVDVTVYRLTGTVRLDSGAAVAAARAVVARSGVEADITVRGDRAAVALSRPVAVRVLGLGSGSVRLSASAEARATWGVSAGR